MRNKILLVAVAILCVFESPATCSLLRDEMKVLRAHRHPLFRKSAITSMLEKMERRLGMAEAKIAKVSELVERSIIVTQKGMEQAVLDMAARWNATVYQLANSSDVAAIKTCLLDHQSIFWLIIGAHLDMKDCVDTPIAELQNLLSEARALAAKADNVYREAKLKIRECLRKGAVVSNALCLIGGLPELEVRQVNVVADALFLCTRIVAKAVGIPALSSACASKVWVGGAAEVSTIVEDIASCVRTVLVGVRNRTSIGAAVARMPIVPVLNLNISDRRNFDLQSSFGFDTPDRQFSNFAPISGLNLSGGHNFNFSLGKPGRKTFGPAPIFSYDTPRRQNVNVAPAIK